MKGLSTFVQSVVAQKISSPIWAAYAFSWLVCNWKSVAYFVLSKSEIGLRLGIIDLSYSGELWEVWGYPAVGALLVLFVFPWLELKYKTLISGIRIETARVKALEEKEYYKSQLATAIARKSVLDVEVDNQSYEELLKKYKKLESSSEQVKNEYGMRVQELSILARELDMVQMLMGELTLPDDSRTREMTERLFTVREQLVAMENSYYQKKSESRESDAGSSLEDELWLKAT